MPPTAVSPVVSEPALRRRPRGRWVPILAGVLTASLLAFVLLPILAIFVQVSPSEILAQLRSPVAVQALLISLKTSAMAMVVIVGVGIPVAYVLSRARWRGAQVVTTLIELPLVLPPAVAGIALLATFGRNGLLGAPLSAMGIELPFTQAAVVMALIFVAIPFQVGTSLAAFRSVDPELLAASRTLGAGPIRTFARVAVPLAAPGLTAGAALAWARALGEFGATLLFAGSFVGRTQTLPLAIYANLADFPIALSMAALLVAVSGGALVCVRLLLRGSELDFRVRGARIV
jgi:molybdate transport system permease protein